MSFGQEGALAKALGLWSLIWPSQGRHWANFGIKDFSDGDVWGHQLLPSELLLGLLPSFGSSSSSVSWVLSWFLDLLLLWVVLVWFD